MKPSPSTELVFSVLTSVLAAVLISAANVFLGSLLPTIPRIVGDLMSGVAITILLLTIYFWNLSTRTPPAPSLLITKGKNFEKVQTLPRPNRWTTMVVVGISVFLIIGVGVAIRWALTEKRTMYFIVDASEDSPSAFRELASRIKLSTLPVPPQTELGLEVFGGGYSSKFGCEDVTELVPPEPKEESTQKISIALELLDQARPIGFSGIQQATEHALNQLANRPDIQQIWILVARLDTRCGELDRKEIDRIAAANNVKYELVIITVGPVNEADQKRLQAFAGRYIYAQNPDEVPLIIEQQSRISPSLYDIYRKVYRSNGP